ncbi:Uma2 family endonuclease [Actinomadura alba]|uniref:Uma2 family endonuclease n=2 Tax=Actinomadura alba TaxID=406431 RepID=A0ABR7LQV4_9ACTN|nr:Uma2 family endonuclease [Actinomadura alba]
MAHEPYPSQDVLLEGFLALRTPEGFRAELIDGEIIVSPPPGGHHERAISRIVRQVMRNSPAEMDFSGNRGLVLPSGGRCPKNHVIPDGVFAPAELDLFADEAAYMRPGGLALVVEVTSSRPDNDREAKRHCYARGAIPLYLLVDRERETVTLFCEPVGDDYTESHAGVFGKAIELPAPFSFTLDTEDLA